MPRTSCAKLHGAMHRKELLTSISEHRRTPTNRPASEQGKVPKRQPGDRAEEAAAVLRWFIHPVSLGRNGCFSTGCLETEGRWQ